jgi:catechol 2,3-dioxygenase-like lactoylglutathione lyase family enzyme
LYPKGAYFGLAALIGPSNLFDIHPSIDLELTDRLNWGMDYDIFWRLSKHDGIYAPNMSVIYAGKIPKKSSSVLSWLQISIISSILLFISDSKLLGLLQVLLFKQKAQERHFYDSAYYASKVLAKTLFKLMENLTYGLHHITAIAGDAQRTYDFYTKLLGLRLVKKTVNFDAPDAYHFYFGDTAGSPGTILTFFAWGDEVKGMPGAGTVSQITFAIPVGSIDFWKKRLAQNNIRFVEQKDGFDENILSFADPDGLSLALIETEKGKTSLPWITSDISAQYATQGFYGITSRSMKLNQVLRY